jgi:exonuclease VII small subunit
LEEILESFDEGIRLIKEGMQDIDEGIDSISKYV